MARGQKRRHRKTSEEERLRGSRGEELFFWFCSECPLQCHVVRNVLKPQTLYKYMMFQVRRQLSPPLLVLHTHTHTHTVHCKHFLPVAGLASLRRKIRAKKIIHLKEEANCAVIAASNIRMTTFLYLDILLKRLLNAQHLLLTPGVLFSVCIVSNEPLELCPHAHVPSFLFSGRFSQTTGQFSNPHFLIGSRSRASKHEFPVTPLCLWSISLLTSLFHCWVTLHGKTSTFFISSEQLSGRSTLIVAGRFASKTEPVWTKI